MTIGTKISLDSGEIEEAVKEYLLKKQLIVVSSAPTHIDIEFFTDYGSVKPNTLTAIAKQREVITY